MIKFETNNIKLILKDYWKLSIEEEKIAKELLKNFTGISIREKGSKDLVKKHFGINPEIVLDPTLLIDKKYYLNLIPNIRNNKKNIQNYIFVYKLNKLQNLNDIIIKSSEELNYKIYEYRLNNRNKIEDFIYYISNSKAVITDSFHGTIFSIIFNKPFISFNWKGSAEERLKSLGDLLGVTNRIISNDQKPEIRLLKIPLYINKKLLKKMKIKSIKYLKKYLLKK